MDERQRAQTQHSALLVQNRFSLIWLIPIAAALVAGWLGWRSFSSRGPTITISFNTAQGIEAGKTKIKHKDADLGIVEKVEATPDLSHIMVTARMSEVTAPYMKAGTKFWVVRPRLSAEGVSGLDTLISGSYIEFEPGKGDSARQFTAEESPPIIAANAPGETYTLHTDQLGSINQGTPVYFHGAKVGQVMGYELSAKDGAALIHLFVHAPYNKLVREGTRFWNTSGVSVMAGSNGIKIQAESIQSLIAGGITFDVPPDADAGNVATPDASFILYGDASAAQDAIYTKKLRFLLHFSEPLPGLAQGSMVRLQGLAVGQVTNVHTEYNKADGSLVMPVTIAVEAERVANLHPNGSKATFEADAYAAFGNLVAHGLRAHLGTGNLLTGQKVIDLDLVEDAPAATLIQGGAYPEIPTNGADDLDGVIRSAKQVLSGLQVTISTLNRAVTSPEMAQSLRSLNASLTNLDHITHDVSIQAGPLMQSLQSVATSADDTLKHTDTAIAGGSDGGDLSGTLHELKNAARSVRVLTDYLESHPDALIRGKPQDAAP